MKKINTFCLVISMVSAILIFTTNSFSQVLPYLGQTPPGINPLKFAPNNSYLASSTWWWRSSPVFSPDGNEMYFVKYFPNTDTHEIWYTKCVNGLWAVAQKAPFSTSKFDGNPVFSQSNDTLYFYSQRPGGFIFSVARAGAGWSEPVALAIPLPTNFAGVTSFYITKHKSVYFAMLDSSKSNPDIWSSADIYKAEFINGQYNQPESIGSPINTNVGETVGYIDQDERFMIYESTKPGGYGWHDLYISSKNLNGTWNDPINLGLKINTDFEDGTPQITPDGKYFFYTTIKGRDQGYSPYWVDAKVIYDLIIDTMVVSDYDGNTYKTVKIGNQIWMAENLRSTHYSDGTPIQYFDYNNDSTNVGVYGRLYTWPSAVRDTQSNNTNLLNVQGISPNGWHLPTQKEWEELINLNGGSNVAGGNLKESGIAHWNSPNSGATNSSGFTAVASGFRGPDGIYYDLGNHGSYWGTAQNAKEPFCVYMYNTSANIISEVSPIDKTSGIAFAVRCIKNDGNTKIDDKRSEPSGYNLFQNYPNPFNPSTTIKYELRTQAVVKLNITNVLGEIVSEVINDVQDAGIHQYNFNAANLSSGIYFYQIIAGNYRETKKMILLR